MNHVVRLSEIEPHRQIIFDAFEMSKGHLINKKKLRRQKAAFLHDIGAAILLCSQRSVVSLDLAALSSRARRALVPVPVQGTGTRWWQRGGENVVERFFRGATNLVLGQVGLGHFSRECGLISVRCLVRRETEDV